MIFEVSRETLRDWMRQAGIWVSRAERKRIQQPRYRREHIGELVQIDGSDHRWFEDRAAPCTLLVFIDDATSRLMELRFVASESTFAYFEALKAYLKHHGKPVAFYSDKHSIFRVSNEDAASGNGMTQFGRALSELNIEILCANTSQAKGRVERAHSYAAGSTGKGTAARRHQHDRCSKRLSARLHRSLQRPFCQASGARERLSSGARSSAGSRQVLCWREQRQVSHQLVVNYSQMKLMLKPEGMAVRLRGKIVEIYDFPDGRLEVRWKGRSLPYSAFDKLQRVSHAAIVENKRLGEVLAWIKEQQDRQPRFATNSRRATALRPEGRSIESPSPAPRRGCQIDPKIPKPPTAPLRYDGLRGACLQSPDSLVTFQLCRNRDISTLLQQTSGNRV